MTYPPPPPPPAPPMYPGERPLWAPYYGATIGVAWTRFWKKYATFSGRASRSDFWWWYLIVVIIGVVLEVVFFATGAGSVFTYSGTGPYQIGPGYVIVSAVSVLFSLVTIVPSFAITWRRLHDTNRSGGYFFVSFIPFVGGIILLVLVASPSDPAGARFDVPEL